MTEITAQEKIAQLEQESLNQVVYNGLTRRVLLAAFDRVANPENWKFKIDTKLAVSDVSPAELETIKMAVTFFTGGVAKIVRRDDWYLITAPGYYVSVGA